MFLPTNITLKFGDSGDFVSELQRRLSVVQCFAEAMINGFFDGNTANGVMQFQSMSGIPADGIAGPETLRRLNGAISGDYSSGATSTTNTEEEERKRREAEAIRQQEILLEQQRLAAEQQIMLAQQQQMLQQQAMQQPAPAQEPQAYQPQPQTYQQPPAQAYIPPQQAYVPPQPQPVQAPPAGPSTAEILAQMLTANPPQQAQMQHQTAQPQHYQQPATHQQQPQSQYYQQPAQSQTYQPYEPATQQQTTPEQPRGIVGRAMQYANEMVGKLAAYFEAKLPRHVIDEVKQIGHAMASSGVKEAPIPMGPEQQRERGVEQQRGQQQGRQIGG